jgi:hypothetical protein
MNLKMSIIAVLAGSNLGCASIQNPQTPKITQTFFEDPAPETVIDTPAFRKTRGFTKHAELMAFLEQLVAEHPRVARLDDIGRSQQGRVIPIVRLSASSTTATPLRVWFQGGLHGNEPASAEGLLLFLDRLLSGSERDALLAEVELVVLPVANVDGYERQVRPAANGLDLNRDQTKLLVPESALLKRAFFEFEPHVAVDFHEYRPYRRDFINFGKWGITQIYDVMFLYSGNLNVPAVLRDFTSRVFVDAARDRVAKEGLRSHDYITTRDVYGEIVFNQGSTNARASATNFALANTVSTLVEVRGVGLSRSGFKRRTLSTAWVAESYLRTAAGNVERTREVLAESARAKGPVVVKSRREREVAKIDAIDVAKVEPIELEIELRNALRSKAVLTRPRPAAYVLLPEAEALARRLELLGVEVEVSNSTRRMRVQGYEVTRRERAPYPYEGTIVQDVETELFDEVREFPPGSFIVSMSQPRGNMAAEVLEPEASNGFVSFGVLRVEEGDRLPIYRRSVE